MKNKEQNFVEYVRKECEENNIKLKIVPEGEVKDKTGESFQGWFDEEARELVVAQKIDKWYQLLAHEFSHMMQWKEKDPIDWDSEEMESYQFIWEPLEKKRINSKLLFEKSVDFYQYLEYDCEQRALALLIKFNLISTKEEEIDYIKQSNAYIYFYSFYKKYRKWCSKLPPNRLKSLRDLMPDRFLKIEEYRKCPYRYNKIVKEECINW